MGLEPTTYALQVRCTTNCATAAYKGSNLRQSDYYIVELYPSRFRIFLMSTGASRRARTFDIRINSASLCQLSYRGINLLTTELNQSYLIGFHLTHNIPNVITLRIQWRLRLASYFQTSPPLL